MMTKNRAITIGIAEILKITDMRILYLLLNISIKDILQKKWTKMTQEVIKKEINLHITNTMN